MRLSRFWFYFPSTHARLILLLLKRLLFPFPRERGEARKELTHPHSRSPIDVMTPSTLATTPTPSLFLFSFRCTYNNLFVTSNFPKTPSSIPGSPKGVQSLKTNPMFYFLVKRKNIKVEKKKIGSLFLSEEGIISEKLRKNIRDRFLYHFLTDEGRRGSEEHGQLVHGPTTDKGFKARSVCL